MRYKLAIILGKAVKFCLRLFGRGGTALPGVVSAYVMPEILQKLTAGVKFGSIVITGTNGKTTSARMISDILDKGGYVVMNNRSGSNLERGLISSFLDVVHWNGESEIDVAVLEVDEADLVNIIHKVSLRQLIITNFFRDQLDRYGEILSLRNLVKKAVEEMAAGSNLILNADDPLVASLDDYAPDGVKVLFFGLNIDYKSDDFASDSRDCVNCGHELRYEKKYLAHLGFYNCQNCGYKRSKPDVVANQLEILGINGSMVNISWPGKDNLIINLPLPGVFNVYNLLAVVSSVSLLEIDHNLLIDGVAKFKPVFGRFEKVIVNNKQIYLLLSKNPTGFNELIKTISFHNAKLNLVFILNDNYADGRDVSWIWDIDLEKLRERVSWLAVSGTRAEDMMVRVKYADYEMNRVGMEKNHRKLIAGILASEGNEDIFVLSTYTGMLEFRGELQKQGFVTGFWED